MEPVPSRRKPLLSNHALAPSVPAHAAAGGRSPHTLPTGAASLAAVTPASLGRLASHTFAKARLFGSTHRPACPTSQREPRSGGAGARQPATCKASPTAEAHSRAESTPRTPTQDEASSWHVPLSARPAAPMAGPGSRHASRNAPGLCRRSSEATRSSPACRKSARPLAATSCDEGLSPRGAERRSRIARSISGPALASSYSPGSRLTHASSSTSAACSRSFGLPPGR